MTWSDDEAALEHAIEQLKKRYPGENVEIITAFDIAWSGWEFDYQGALIRRDGVPELVIVDQTGGDDRLVCEILEAKVEEYDRLAAETRRVLSQHMVLEGLREFAIEEPQPGDEMPDADYRLEIAEMVIGGASLDEILAAHPGADIGEVMRWHAEEHGDDLGNTYAAREWRGIEIKRRPNDQLRKLADEYPDEELEIVCGDGTGDLVTDLGLPESTSTLWALVRGLNAMIATMGVTPAELARDADLPIQEVQDLYDGRIQGVTLERVIEMYDAAAVKAGKRTVPEIIEGEG